MENIDIDNAISPTFINTTQKPYRNCHTIKDSSGTTTIGYTIKNGDYYWFYAPVKKPQPTLKTETFYTSNDKAFPVVMKDAQTVDIEESKKLLQNELPAIAKDEDKKMAEEFIAYTGAAAELIEIEEKILLFVKVNDRTTKVFHKEAGTHLKDAFKSSVATIGTMPSDVNLAKANAPTWITDGEKQDITHFVKVNNGYTVLTKSGHWFYVPYKDPEIVSFYTSNNNQFPVALSSPMVVNLKVSKQLLQDALPRITNAEDKKLAEEFIAKATDNDVEIQKIHNQRLLFVKVNDHTTKVFRDSTDSLFQNAFKHTNATKGEPVNIDLKKAIAPKWISD